MVERRVLNGSYLCTLYSGGVGANHEFKVAHLTPDHTWGAFRDGVLFESRDLNFNIPSHVFAVGEYHSPPPTSYTMTYGPTGATPWQVRLSTGVYATINIATSFDPGDHWGTGSLPSPFNLTRN